MSIFQDEQTHPIVLFRAVVRKYGIECFEWEFDVFKRTITNDYKPPANLNIHKILAAITVTQNDRFWQEWEVFNFVAQALNNVVPSGEHISDLSVGQMMVAVDIAETLRRELGKFTHKPDLSEEVLRFIAAQALDDGVWHLLEPLQAADTFSARRMVECMDCGDQHFLVTPADKICPICTKMYDMEEGINSRPHPDMVKKKKGRNIRIIEKNPTNKVKMLLKAYRMGKIKEFNVTPDGICAAKLVIAQEYMQMRRKQYLEQS